MPEIWLALNCIWSDPPRNICRMALSSSQNTWTHPKTNQLSPQCSYQWLWHACWDSEQREGGGPLSRWLSCARPCPRQHALWLLVQHINGIILMQLSRPALPKIQSMMSKGQNSLWLNDIWLLIWWFHLMGSDITHVVIVHRCLQSNKGSTKECVSFLSQ